MNDRLVELMAAYTPALRVALLLQGVAASDVDDILSQVWERAWRHLATLGPKPYHWLLTVARHGAIDHHRAAQRRNLIVAWPDDEPSWANLPDPAPRPADVLDAAERERLLVGRIHDLPPEVAAVVVAVGANGLTIRAAAERLGLTQGCAYKRLVRGRLLLAAAMAGRAREAA